MRILYDSKEKNHKEPFGCVRENEMCRMTVYIPENCRVQRAFLKVRDENGFLLTLPLKKDGGENGYAYYTGEFSLFSRGLYFYYFRIETAENAFSLFKYGDRDTNMEEGEEWQLTCIPADFRTPDAYKGAVFYQIFPDRFYKDSVLPAAGKLTPYFVHASENETPVYLPDENGKIQNNDFYGGNLRGIIKKLPYIASLGVDVIYLNPVFLAYSNHRYDTADYKKIDPMLGTEEDFTALCEAAHKKGIRVILDGVFSHTGADSIYFDKMGRFGGGAYQNPDSPYYDWYQFTEEGYISWWGIETLPCVREMQPSYLSYIIDDADSVVAHWLHAGADGFRLDVADELPDDFIAGLTKRVHEIKKDALVIGEVWEDASNKISYGVRRRYFADGELDSVMNYPFRNSILSFISGQCVAQKAASEIMTVCENYPNEVLHCLLNSLSTHDTPRALTLLSGVSMPQTKNERASFFLSGAELERAIKQEMAAVFLQFILPGAPCIYYGDEVGMQGCEDPFNRRFYPWGSENTELLTFYKKMAGYKKNIKSLRGGDTRVTAPNADTLLIRRQAGTETVYGCVCRKGTYAAENAKILYTSSGTDIIRDGDFILFYGV